ncbi:hypothetical protein [Tenggerimyces flavus]|uniref:Uncharacterized protein n=1 Tax=Tenggerimyces flavus TaxID=1708749 RepID=A0ABV7YKD9_9ACTN|nr:hypothetical protein [Tenggerimyces flavus]MBM7789561.1 hypothetical protein [Tenggerimyces flavus]
MTEKRTRDYDLAGDCSDRPNDRLYRSSAYMDGDDCIRQAIDTEPTEGDIVYPRDAGGKTMLRRRIRSF